MVLLCFVLDLRSLSPSIFRDLKQSLFQLANYYAVSVSSPKMNKSSYKTESSSTPLLDRIGLCYVVRNRTSCYDDVLKIAYNPQGNFNLRDFHHALNNLPADAFLPEFHDPGDLCRDLKLADVLTENIMYTWGGHDENIAKKVISISSSLSGTLDSGTMKSLMDAAYANVSVEFIFLEQRSNHFADIPNDINHFIEQIGSLRNCSFQTCVPDLQVLYGLVKRWLRELKDDRDESLQATLVFKTNLISTMNQISCNLYTSFNHMVDEFHFCQTCRCHGIPLDRSDMNPRRSSSCPVTNDDLGDFDINENSVKIGEQTILYMPSFQGASKPNQVSSPAEFNVIQRTNLGSLSEGKILLPSCDFGINSPDTVKQSRREANPDHVFSRELIETEIGKSPHIANTIGLIMGAAYFVTPTLHYTDGNDEKSELNSLLFQAVCNVLNSLDQGLVCSSTCNIETGKETSFNCYYILLPSDKGLMLLRRLLALEEFLPIPDISRLIIPMGFEEIKNTVEDSLLKIEASDYNPVQHERGFHKKLNLLVKESLQFGAILPKSKLNPESNLDRNNPKDQPSVVVTENELTQCDTRQGQKIETISSLSEEWEKLIVNELGVIMPSSTCNPVSKPDRPVISASQNNNRQLVEKTSRILERLEIPRQLKRKAVSPTFSSSLSSDVCGAVKKPLIPYKALSSQPLKPSFQRIKRKT